MAYAPQSGTLTDTFVLAILAEWQRRTQGPLDTLSPKYPLLGVILLCDLKPHCLHSCGWILRMEADLWKREIGSLLQAFRWKSQAKKSQRNLMADKQCSSKGKNINFGLFALALAGPSYSSDASFEVLRRGCTFPYHSGSPGSELRNTSERSGSQITFFHSSSCISYPNQRPD